MRRERQPKAPAGCWEQPSSLPLRHKQIRSLGLVGVIAEGAAKRIILILVGAETFAGSRPSSDKYSQRVMSEV
jgi:hypothetical protein